MGLWGPQPLRRPPCSPPASILCSVLPTSPPPPTLPPPPPPPRSAHRLREGGERDWEPPSRSGGSAMGLGGRGLGGGKRGEGWGGGNVRGNRGLLAQGGGLTAEGTPHIHTHTHGVLTHKHTSVSWGGGTDVGWGGEGGHEKGWKWGVRGLHSLVHKCDAACKCTTALRSAMLRHGANICTHRVRGSKGSPLHPPPPLCALRCAMGEAAHACACGATRLSTDTFTLRGAERALSPLLLSIPSYQCLPLFPQNTPLCFPNPPPPPLH